jgi:hypothetical protein
MKFMRVRSEEVGKSIDEVQSPQASLENCSSRNVYQSKPFYLPRAIISECMASFLYVFIVCGAAAGAGIGASVSSVLLTTSLASGLSIAVLTHCFIHISGRNRENLGKSIECLPSVDESSL